MPRAASADGLRLHCWYVCAPHTFDRAWLTPRRFARLNRAGLVVVVLGVSGSMV